MHSSQPNESHGTEAPILRAIAAGGREAIAPEPELTRLGELKDPALEQEFRDYRYDRELAGPLRWSAWSVTAIYFLFGPVDYVVVWDVAELAWTIRYAAVVPVSLALAILASTRHARRTHRFIGVAHSLMGPALFLTVGELAVDPGGLLYTLWGALLFPLLVPQLTRLGVAWSLLISGITLVSLVALDTVFSPREVWEQLFVALFMLTGCGYAAWATYAAELAGRKSFWQEKVIAWQMAELGVEREKSERLLLNVLPASIASRLRSAEGQTIADSFEEVTVLFADIAGFTSYSMKVSAEQLVSRLDAIFSRFDRIADELSLEKIKTIGDAYMVAAGLPHSHPDGPAAVALMALRMRAAVDEVNAEADESFAVRIGVHTGPAVAGVIGRRKFIYDIWGDTVNTASRMESHGEIGKIQLSEATAERLADRFELEERGVVELKGRGTMRTFWLVGEAPRGVRRSGS